MTDNQGYYKLSNLYLKYRLNYTMEIYKMHYISTTKCFFAYKNAYPHLICKKTSHFPQIKYFWMQEEHLWMNWNHYQPVYICIFQYRCCHSVFKIFKGKTDDCMSSDDLSNLAFEFDLGLVKVGPFWQCN